MLWVYRDMYTKTDHRKQNYLHCHDVSWSFKRFLVFHDRQRIICTFSWRLATLSFDADENGHNQSAILSKIAVCFNLRCSFVGI